MPLTDLLSQVTAMKACGKTILLSDHEKQLKYTANARKDKIVRSKELSSYALGSRYGKIYFTKREAECMVLLLKGKTINSVASCLDLSPRTVEYYVKNMKAKLGCKTKFELIDLVYASDFLKNVDF